MKRKNISLGCIKHENPVKSLAIAGLFLCFLSFGTACVQSVESVESNSYEKGVIRIDNRNDSGYQALREQQLMELDEEENPAGFLQTHCSNVCVQVRIGNLKGSGIIIASNQEYVWIATAGHVLDGQTGTVKITFTDGYELETDQYQRLEPQDLAIVKVGRGDLVETVASENAEERREDHGENYCSAILSLEAFDAVKVGDLIVAMGSKSGAGEEAYAGNITQDYIYLEDFGTYMMVADVMVSPGMSGGGIFDAKGRLLGIICGVSEEGDVAFSSIMSLMALDLGQSGDAS